MYLSTPSSSDQPRTEAQDGASGGDLYQGFCPVFRDLLNGETHFSLNQDGSLAEQHLFDNLPLEWVEEWDEDGLPRSLKPTIIAGFWRYGQFYTFAELAHLQGRDA
ncbi:hypothetical protein Q4485_06790 [Granulosicoccaceae sp. 1_MG-2023]|nr:hypothetical protein [Granulosicoccaceae sp. 1_MG-2023]